MNASPTTGTIQTTAALTLWRAAEAFMHLLHALFGAPEQVATQHTLTLKAHRLMASWLRCGEAMMRRLLLIEAAAFSKPNTRPLLRAARKRTRKLMHFFPETPERWRVSFRCFYGPLASRQHASAPAGETPAAHTERLSKDAARRPFIFREQPRAETPNRAQRRHGNRTRHKPILRQEREWVQYQEPLEFRSAWPLAERYEALLRAFNNPLAYARRLSARLHATPHRSRKLLHAPPDIRERIDQFDAFTASAETAAAVFNTS